MRAILIIILLVSAAPVLAQEHPLRGVALVIGQSKYAGTLPALANPRNDARAMDEMLGNLGFEVTRVLDGDSRKLAREVEDFVSASRLADVALVYYSGHGIEAAGENYLVPVDADLSTPQRAGETLVPLASLLGPLAETVPVTIVLLDACRTNALPVGTMIQPAGASEPIPASENGLAEVRGPTPVAMPGTPATNLGMVIGFAASPGQPALDGNPGENSPYAAALLKHLNASGYSFGDVMTMVGEEVYLKTRARQLPWVNSSLRRVLNFGQASEDPDPDKRAISQGRRQLLLTIGIEQDSTRSYVEAVARSEGVPLDALYGMLKVLGVNTSDPTQLETRLIEGARQLKEFAAQKQGPISSDAELARIAALADEAQGEGAMELALSYRQLATERARSLSTQRDKLEEQLKQDRLDIATTFASHAQTAALNFDYATAAGMFSEAYIQVERWDAALALRYKWRQADMLHALGEWTGNNEALASAVDAYNVALSLAPRDANVRDWAQVTNNLANTHTAIADRVGDPALLRQAIAEYASVLEASPQASEADAWARAENNLGVALTKLSRFDRGTSATLEQAVAAFRAALSINTRAGRPFEWAELEVNLGVALSTLGSLRNSTVDHQAAEDAFGAALEVYAKATAPLKWATTELNLADARKHLGKLDAAEAATRAALSEFTVDKTPLAWAHAQNNLGVLLHDIANRDDNIAGLAKSADAYDAALSVFTRESTPQLWAQANTNLGVALTDLALKVVDADIAKTAVDALKASLTIYNQEATFSDWLNSASTLANSMLVLGAISDDQTIIQASIDEHLKVLKAFTREENQERWDFLQHSLGVAQSLLKSGQLADPL